MDTNRPATHSDVHFMKLFFPSPVEERIAMHWASLLSSIVGNEIGNLRPETPFEEIVNWIDRSGEDAATSFEIALTMEVGEDIPVEDLMG